MMARSWADQNPAFEVEWQGFRSNSAAMGRCGWKLAMAQRPERDVVRVMFHHPGIRLTLMGESSDFWRHRAGELHGHRVLIRIGHVYREGDVFRHIGAGGPLDDFTWVDTQPAHIHVTETEFHSLPLFRELDKPIAQELIVDPADVGRILELVHRAQAPEQAAIRDRNRRRDVPVQMHAHILSLAA